MPENANKKNLSVLRSIYPEKSRIKNQIFTCPKIDNQKTRKKKNQLVYVTSRMCTVTTHIGTGIELAICIGINRFITLRSHCVQQNLKL